MEQFIHPEYRLPDSSMAPQRRPQALSLLDFYTQQRGKLAVRHGGNEANCFVAPADAVGEVEGKLP
ncbi:MAG: hypothetical protein VB071_00620 [Lawsonibacter sp.]|nr:hypothetical protein [Lawsonibacter sp.]